MTRVHNTTSTSNEFFDLHDYINEMPEAYVAAQMAQSVAWRIDTLLISNARILFKNVREVLYEQGVDGYAELTAALHEAEFAEKSFMEIGTLQDGTLEKLRQLNAQRDQWHYLAQNMVALTLDWQGSPRLYEVPDLETVFRKEPTLRVNADTKRKLERRADVMAQAYNTGNEGREQFLRASLARQETKLGRVKEAMKDSAGAVWFMFQMALRDDKESASTRSTGFSALAIDDQRTLVLSARQAASRAVEYAADERNMSDMEYDRILMNAVKVDQELTKLLRAPKFVAEQRLREAATV